MSDARDPSEERTSKDFVRARIDADRAAGKHGGRVQTRFPPEPNGYLHVGHAKAIVLNFDLAGEYGGLCNLRFDDTNPEKEEQQYVEGIQRDVRWLGYDWEDRLFFASDYFGKLYECAQQLVRDGKAYICELSSEQVREYRGTLYEPGRPSPFRDRPAEESLRLLEEMRLGRIEEGKYTLRAKIDMASPNMNMRDPAIYRIRRRAHDRTGDTWSIYPMYDFAHPLSDSIEEITHSLCTLEFENHRPLYDWFVRELGMFPSQQIEFARLNVTYTITSKRKLLQLVEGGYVEGWDDPRMPTLIGMRRRGFTPESIRTFCRRVGVAKYNSTNEVELLEHAVREDLNKRAERRMAVLDPLEVVIENWPAGQVEELEAVNNPEDAAAGTRKVPFSGRLFIEREDFMEDPPKKFFRLGPGREVRLRYAYFITCTGVDRDEEGKIVRVRCTYDPETRGGDAPDGRKVKGTIHWVSADHAVEAEVRLYDRLFVEPDPAAVWDEKPLKEILNPESLVRLEGCRLEPSLAELQPETCIQFERLGYFVADMREHSAAHPVFNRCVALRDSWARLQKRPVV